MAKIDISIHIGNEQRISARVEETTVIHIGLNSSLSQGGNSLKFSSPAGMEQFRDKLDPLERMRAWLEQENQGLMKPEVSGETTKELGKKLVAGNDTRAVVEIEDDDEITLSCTLEDVTVRIGRHVSLKSSHQKIADLKRKMGYALETARRTG